MLILCVGMYRACSTWQYGVVGELLERHRDGLRLGFADGGAFVSAVEPTLEDSRWSVLKAHDAHDRFAQRLGRGRALGIYSYRDVRDVAFSWMHKAGLTFQQIIERRFLEQCIRNDRFWRDRAGMLVQSYEDLIADPTRGVAEIAAHLGIELSTGEDAEIAGLLSLEANRERTLEIAGRLEAEGVALDATDLDHYDRRTLLHWNHVRDGRAGSWRDLATPEQVEILNRICGGWLVERGYGIDPDRPARIKRAIEPYHENSPRVTFAKNMEDVFLDRVFRGKKGTFIDVGAYHPTSINGTYYFYKRGWRGVNFEPVPAAFELFDQIRPADLNLQVAISDVEETQTFYEVADCHGLSSLSPELADLHRAKGFQVVEHVLTTRTIASLVSQYGLFPPDIFSINVEGNEEQVLRGIPLATWKPKVFVIDATLPMTNTLCHQAWEPILLEQGYLFAMFDGISRFYLRGDLADWLPLLQIPVNALDNYIKADVFEQRDRADSLQRLLAEERSRADDGFARFAEEQRQFAILRDRFSQELQDRHRDWVAWQEDREHLRIEREAAQAERDAWESERQVARLERQDQLRTLEELQTRQADLAREVDSLHGVIARLQAEIHDRDVDLDQTRNMLRPYLRIDRLGVVPALQRRVRAHRGHVAS